ncbi:IclR family transcriptional regulator [Streptomyces sp. NPDC053431]|uniref:IclR family transcriptional regulator n=1 Tax=Streptomyces sp. NPDC053431 TaxID=3365703 RepID=UPI0037D07682
MTAELVGPAPATPSLLDKAARVLAAFEGAEPRLSLTEVIRRSGVPRSSAHRILDQLVRLRWLDREGRDYRMGVRMLELGALAAHHNRLRRAALPHLHALHESTGHLVHLSVLDGGVDGVDGVLCLERIGGSEDSAVPSRAGGRLPAHSTASGKALLAFGDPAALGRVLARRLRPLTPRTLVGPVALRSELAAAAARGAAFDREETYRGVSCVAVPLRGAGRAIAALSVSGHGLHRDLDRLVPTVAARARAIWHDLHGPGRRTEPRATADRGPAARGRVSEREMESMMGWLRFSDWM